MSKMFPSRSMRLAAYANGGFEVEVFADGTKIRVARAPDIPPRHPEQLDLKITDWCDAGCAWCHEGSTRRGRHAEIDPILNLLAPLPAGVEIAIGGGDPLSHPEFERLVGALAGRGLLPSVTVDGRHLARHLQRLARLKAEGRLFGLGVSVHRHLPDLVLPDMVTHMVAGIDDPALLDGVPRRRVLVLGWKDHGRGAAFRARRPASVAASLDRWFRALPWIAGRHDLHFDTLAIAQMRPERLFRSRAAFERSFMGAEGEFSLYLDAVTRRFAVSSYSAERHPWTEIGEMFRVVRAASRAA